MPAPCPVPASVVGWSPSGLPRNPGRLRCSARLCPKYCKSSSENSNSRSVCLPSTPLQTQGWPWYCGDWDGLCRPVGAGVALAALGRVQLVRDSHGSTGGAGHVLKLPTCGFMELHLGADPAPRLADGLLWALWRPQGKGSHILKAEMGDHDVRLHFSPLVSTGTLKARMCC